MDTTAVIYNYIGVEMEDDDFYPARLCGLELGMVIDRSAKMRPIRLGYIYIYIYNSLKMH